MAYDFSSAWEAAGMNRVVTTMTLETTTPSSVAAGSLGTMSAKTVSTQSLTTSSPSVQATPGTRTTPVAPSIQPMDVASSGGGRREHDPYINANFVLEVDGIEAGSFQKFDGFSWECDLIEYRDGMDPYPRKRPGMKRYANIKLTKGYITNTALWDWCNSISQGSIDRRTGAVHLILEDGDPGHR